MKKLAFLMVFAMAFALMSGLALAETPHGPFDDNTALCAACHRTHTALADYLMAKPQITSLCVTCHTDGQGADTNVVNGTYVSDGTAASTPANPNHADWGTPGQALMGGGFSAVTGSVTTSKHMNPTNTQTTWDVRFGNGNAPGATVTNLDCVDCHMPHRSGNYRMLRKTVNTVPNLSVTHNLGSPITGSHNYTEGAGTQATAAAMWNVSGGISEWCGACHDYYFDNAQTGSNGDVARVQPSIVNKGAAAYYNLDGAAGAETTFMHAVDVDLSYMPRNGSSSTPINQANNLKQSANVNKYKLPTISVGSAADYNNGQTMSCLTCHRAHGSSAAMSGAAALAVRTADGKNLPAGGDSVLLRLDNRGVCETCHDMPQGY